MKQQKMDGAISPHSAWRPRKTLKHYELAPQTVADVEVVGDENVTVATATLGNLQGVGTARRAPGDPRNGLLGINIATQRALAALSARLVDHIEEEIEILVSAERDLADRRQERYMIREDQLEKEDFNRRNPDAHDKRRREGALAHANRTDDISSTDE